MAVNSVPQCAEWSAMQSLLVNEATNKDSSLGQMRPLCATRSVKVSEMNGAINEEVAIKQVMSS